MMIMMIIVVKEFLEWLCCNVQRSMYSGCSNKTKFNSRLLWENPFIIVMNNNGVHIHSIDDSILAPHSGIIERFLIKIFVENVIQMGNKFQNEIDTIRISKKQREI